ncbi:MAG: response regulator transcription factor [Trebonia sp.]
MTGACTEVRLVIADDHTLFRAGLVALLKSVPGFTVEAECSSSEEAIALCRALRPDVLILDVEMPGPDTRAVVQNVRSDSPDTRVVIVTMHDNGSLMRDLITSGASGFLHKSVDQATLAATVRSVLKNPDRLIVNLSRKSILADDMTGTEARTISLVSARELEVLALLSDGKSNTEIASKLFISRSTVKRHLTNIYAKLGAVSRVDALRRAEAAGLLSRPQVGGLTRDRGSGHFWR